MTDQLTDGEKQTLLRLAREAIECAVRGQVLLPLDIKSLTPLLQANGSSFVTLTIDDDLRGCIGALEAYQRLTSASNWSRLADNFNINPVWSVRPSNLP